MSFSPFGAPGTPSPSASSLSPFFPSQQAQASTATTAQSHPADQISHSPDDSRFLGTIGQPRRPSSTVGTIGEPRRGTTPTAPPSQSQSRDHHDAAFLGLPLGAFDASLGAVDLARSASLDGGAPRPGSANSPAAAALSKSRPSSFILDVLPQTRERSAPPTPSLSLDSVSAATGTELHHHHHQHQHPPSLPSPHSLAPSSYLASASNASLAALSQSTVLSTASRTSSPGPLDNLPPSGGGGGGGGGGHHNLLAVDALATKVHALEGTVASLSGLVSTELRSLRDEVGLLRSLVLQQQQQQPSQHALGNGNGNAGSRWPGPGLGAEHSSSPAAADSPLLTLRSPSPGQQSLFGRPGMPHLHPAHGSPSSLLGQPSTSPGGAGGGYFPAPPTGPLDDSSAASSGASAAAAAAKDEQIKHLTAQVSHLSSTVSQLLSSSSSSSPSPAPGGGPQRGVSLSALGSPGAGVGAASTGLGMSVSPGPGLAGRPTPMMRTASGTPLARTASMRSASGVGPAPAALSLGLLGPGATGGVGAGGAAGPGAGMGSYVVESASAWEGAMSSPMIGGPSSGGGAGVGVGVGVAPGVGGGNNPPGSLGAKWEVLGVGQDLFRAIAKYGCVGRAVSLSPRARGVLVSHGERARKD